MSGTQLRIKHIRENKEGAFPHARLLHALPQLIWVAYPDGYVAFVNKRFVDYTGLTREMTHAGAWRSVLHPDDAEAQAIAWQEAQETGREFIWEYRLRSQADGQYRWFLVRELPECNEDGDILWWIGTATDISAQKQLEEQQRLQLVEARERAERDALTGLLNRSAFDRRLLHALQTPSVPCAVVLFDLDNFKFFNDAYGHQAGDEVLSTVAHVLRTSCRQNDAVARLGGDEFAALLYGVDRWTAEQRVKTMKDAVAHLGYRPGRGDRRVQAPRVPLGLSGGVAIIPTDADTISEALSIADDRLYRDKATGRALWSKNLTEELSERYPGFSMLDSLVTAVDSKDRYTRRHSEDVLVLVVSIGHDLGLKEEELEALQLAALVHDVGKVAVPDRLLRLPGRLTPEEYEMIQQHAALGAALIASTAPELVSKVPTIQGAVRHHHERWDGSGYPDGLSGVNIPLHARILAVADAFSAMTHERPYRHSFTPADALAELRAGSGTQWDPVCVEAIINALR